MYKSDQISDPFGAFMPPSWSMALFNHVPKAVDINRHYASIIRRIAELGSGDIIDIETAQCGKTRLYLKDNASDRWLVKGYDIVDKRELLEIAKVFQQLDRPGVFYDIGANAGLYSLSLISTLKNLTDIDLPQIHAFEPNPNMANRLADNVNFNALSNIEIAPIALSSHNDTLWLDVGIARNLGEASLVEHKSEAQKPVAVSAQTLKHYIELNNAPHPDVMKLDIEGHEVEVLTAFWQDCPHIRPRLIACEMWDKNSDQLHACFAKGGYEFMSMPGENALFRYREEN